ncbi:unnamed protein product [Dracunculus medinensis]|uniref:Lipase member M n=1 Tax=Dracunculus medinensis TaxID=318479 RepID=A0A0N4UNH7_DRAME|nr:unnamed protein product [Dracunculus medinensis]
MCISLCIHNLRPYFQLMKYLFGNKEFLPNNWISQILARFVCGMAYTNVFCDNFLFLIVGPDSNQLNKTRTAVYLSHTPAGTSAQNLFHWIQMVYSGQIQAYDFGTVAENMLHYGQKSPPFYNMAQVNSSLYLLWSSNDWLADEIDIKRFPGFRNQRGYPCDGFQHCHQYFTVLYTRIKFLDKESKEVKEVFQEMLTFKESISETEQCM